MPYKNKEDQLACQRNWYKRNKEKEYKRIKKRRQEIKDWIRKYKETLSCEICNENHPATIDFHHHNPKEKDFNISEAERKGMSKKKILEEINKCQILCSNCHRKLHWK